MITLADAYLFLAEMSEMGFPDSEMLKRNNEELIKDIFSLHMINRMDNLEHDLMSLEEYNNFWDDKSYLNWMIFLSSYCDEEGL